LCMVFSLMIFEKESVAIVSGKSFLKTMPLFHPITPPLIALIRSDVMATCPFKKNNIEVVAIGSQTNHSEAIARYFLPFGKKTIICGELGSKAVLEGYADVIASYFGVLTSSQYVSGEPIEPKIREYTFESELTLNPQQTREGFCFSYHRHLSECLEKGWYVHVDVPFEWVRNDMHLSEKIIVPGGPDGNDPHVPKGYVGNMTEAFAGDVMNWRFGRIKGSQKDVGLADIFVRVGYVYRTHETRHFEGYAGVIVPTGNKPKNEFVFEPMVGNHQQMGGFFGTSIGLQLWSNPVCDRSLYWELDTASTFYATVQQTRSFDLKNNVWSRYMWVYRSPNSINTSPGINVFTHLVDVEPGSMRDLNTAYIFRQGGFVTELGYHFAGIGSEKLSFVEDFEDEVAIAAITQGNQFIGSDKVSRNNATVNHYMNIGNDINGNGVQIYKSITTEDFDLESATQPTTIIHTGYCALGYHWECDKKPLFVGLGGSYDYVPDNTAMRRWQVWGVLNCSF
jgi:hypothetical protein